MLAMILPSVARGFLRFSFATEASLRRALRAALSTETLAAAAVTTSVVRDNLRFLAALRSAISLTSSAFVSSEMSDPAEDEHSVPSSPPESLSLLSLSFSLASSSPESSWFSTSRSLAFLAAVVAARFAAFDSPCLPVGGCDAGGVALPGPLPLAPLCCAAEDKRGIEKSVQAPERFEATRQSPVGRKPKKIGSLNPQFHLLHTPAHPPVVAAVS